MPFASSIASWLLTYRYLIVYPLAVIEGPVLMLFCGFLIRIGFFDFWPTYLLLIAGDFTGDIAWYLVGRHGARPLAEKYGKFLSIEESHIEKLETLFEKHDVKILFISKITMGFGFALATLIAAGAAKVPLKKYLTINLIGQFIWTGILILAGYFLGQLYTTIDKSFRWAFVVGVVIVIAFMIYGFGKYMRARLKEKLG